MYELYINNSLISRMTHDDEGAEKYQCMNSILSILRDPDLLGAKTKLIKIRGESEEDYTASPAAISLSWSNVFSSLF